MPHETRAAVPSAATTTLHCSRETVSFGLCIFQRLSTWLGFRLGLELGLELGLVGKS